MKKILILLGLVGIIVFGAISMADARQEGRMVVDANLYKHQWDVAPEFNFQCKVKAGHIVRIANRINWRGEQLIHVRAGICDGWTYARNFKRL